MYLGQMTGQVELGDKYILGGFESVEIKKSVHSLIQTAKLTLPATVKKKENGAFKRVLLANEIKEGDAIKISFGYNNKNAIEFAGYIKVIDRKKPVEIECEDEMYLFSKTKISKTFSGEIKAVLAELATMVSKDIKVSNDIPSLKLENLVVNNQTALCVVQKIKEWYPMLSIRFVNGVLVCHLLYKVKDIQQRVYYELNGSKNNVITADELKYNVEPKRVQVNWEVAQKNGKVEKLQRGDRTPEVTVNLKLQQPVDAETLDELTQNEIEKAGGIGYRGSIETFLFPYSEPGMIANIKDREFEREGNYFIGTVTTSFSASGGGRRRPEIDFKLR